MSITPSTGLDLRSIRSILWIPFAMGVLMIGVALVAGEHRLAIAFLPLCLAALGVRFALRPLRADARREFSTGETLATAAVAWALTALLGALPFWIGAHLPAASDALAPFTSPLAALFESMSGFTSTGLTMVDKESELPATIQLWRSLTEWVGGAGLALLMLTLLNPDRDGGDLFDSELSLPLADGAGEAARRVWGIYVALTAFSIGLFAATGMPLWQSLNHGLTGIATGGFSVTDDSFSSYALSVQISAMLIVLLGAISFAAYHEAFLDRRPLGILKRGPMLVLLGGLLLATLLLWFARREFETDGGLPTLAFQVVSAFTTAGFSSATLGDWHSAPLAVLVVCMTIGGMSGATTGGIKTDRVLLILRGIGWRLQRLFGGEREHRVEGERHGSEQARLKVEGAATLVALWLVTWLFGCLLLASAVGDDWTFTQVAFETMSAQSGVGLSSGITTSELATGGKWVLICLMWAGRLELIAILALSWLPFAGRASDEGRAEPAKEERTEG